MAEQSHPMEFTINFNFKNKVESAFLMMVELADHDEYHVLPKDSILAKAHGNQIVGFYHDSLKPLKDPNIGDEYLNSIIAGVQDFLKRKH